MRFVYLLDMENPYGQVMLDILLRRGLIPAMIVEEDSPQAEEHRERWKQRLCGRTVAPCIASQVKNYGLRYSRVLDLNDAESNIRAGSQSPNLIVVGGTMRLIKKKILSIPSWGTLLVHPGLLPYVRGSASVAWSIYEDLPVGCSCILVDEGIDTGPILKTRIVPVYRGDTFDQVIERSLIACGELMADVVTIFKEKNGPIAGERQDLSLGKTYRNKEMTPDLIKIIHSKLANERFIINRDFTESEVEARRRIDGC